MTLERFRDEPWRTSHQVYQESALAMSPAPEYASSEVILSSLYRHAGFQAATEGTVPQRGRDLDRKIERYRNRPEPPGGAALDADRFHLLLHSVLESPKLPNQSSKRFVQVTPLVPQAALFSGSARLSNNSWPAGALVKRMIWLGSPDQDRASQTWRSICDALSVTDDDDIFARFLQAEITAWVPEPTWEALPVSSEELLDPEDRRDASYPARQFVRDVDSIIAAKHAMTRRQWTSLLEAIVRIGVVAHVAWLCAVHSQAWQCVRQAITGVSLPNTAEVRSRVFPQNFTLLSYGDRALPSIKDGASAFLKARLGLNAVLWTLQAENGDRPRSLSSAEGIATLCEEAYASRSAIESRKLMDILSEVEERETRALLCKKGIGSNIMEFARYVLGQRQAASPILRGYDQGYALRKRGTSNSSPWVLGLGPVAVLALVHCALASTTGPRSVHRLSQHLAKYGLAVDHREIATNDLGHQLRMLGLVLDSPDAESGMLLVPPFTIAELAH